MLTTTMVTVKWTAGAQESIDVDGKKVVTVVIGIDDSKIVQRTRIQVVMIVVTPITLKAEVVLVNVSVLMATMH